MQGMGSNPILECKLWIQVIQNISPIFLKLYISLPLIIINYKNKNPQVNLMGSNPNPKTSITSFSLKKK